MERLTREMGRERRAVWEVVVLQMGSVASVLRVLSDFGAAVRTIAREVAILRDRSGRAGA